jgi:hypothetical protein
MKCCHTMCSTNRELHSNLAEEDLLRAQCSPLSSPSTNLQPKLIGSSMSDFTEPDRRRRKRKGPKFQDPAALTLEERLSRLQRTLQARRTQYYEDPATKGKWLGQWPRLAIAPTANCSCSYLICRTASVRPGDRARRRVSFGRKPIFSVFFDKPR